jgi:hypothetical protein
MKRVILVSLFLLTVVLAPSVSASTRTRPTRTSESLIVRTILRVVQALEGVVIPRP